MENRVQTVCLVILTVIASAAALYWLRPVMIPFIIAALITLGLTSITEFMIARARVPHALALPAAGLSVLIAGLAIWSLVSASVAELSASAPAYASQFSRLITQVIEAMPAEARELGGAVQLENLVQRAVSTVSSLFANTANAVLGLLSNSFLVLVFVLFMVLGNKGRRVHSAGAWAAIESKVKSYLAVKTGVSALTGVLVGSILSILGVPLAMVFGLFAFLLNFIPNVGSVISVFLPIPVVIGSPDISSGTAILAIGLPAAVQISVGNFIEPKLMGDSLDLHPVVILVALIFWGMLWGVMGMLLATPITAAIKLLLEGSEGSRPLAELLAGRVDALRAGP